MKLIFSAFCLLATGALPLVTQASWFDFCDLGGEIIAVRPAATSESYTLEVQITEASRAVSGAGYTDCSEHRGAAMEVDLTVPRREGVPEPGDRINFSRSAFDVFSSVDGSYHLKVSTELHTLTKGGSVSDD